MVKHALATALSLLIFTTATPADLTPAYDRASLRAILAIRHAHEIGRTDPFESVYPDALVDARVEETSKREEALRRFWGIEITGPMLQAEWERMRRASRMPDRLRELEAALGNDPVRIANALVRPVLVRRWLRSRFERDPRIHEQARREAEEFLAAVRGGRVNPDSCADARCTALVARPATGPRTRTVWKAVPDAVSEGAEEFLVTLEREGRDGESERAVYTFPKRSWSDWWKSVEPDLSGAAPLARTDVRVPAIRREDEAPCGPEGRWDPSLLAGGPEERSEHGAVWTGSRMIVFGGWADGLSHATSRGMAYDPATDTWEPIASAGAPSGRAKPALVWTGREVLVWGGYTYRPIPGSSSYQSFPLRDGARYDPILDSWTPIPLEGAPERTILPSSGWVAGELLIWGGRRYSDDGDAESLVNTGAAFSPETGRWRSISTSGAPYARLASPAATVGDRWFVWGGYVLHSQLAAGGGLYDPASDSWTIVSTNLAPFVHEDPAVVSLGSRAAVITARSDYQNRQAKIYDPSTDSWSTLPPPPARVGRIYTVAAWTGTEILAWNTQVLEGARYSLESGQWTPISFAGAPGSRTGASGVWSPEGFIVWGGDASGPSRNDGGVYHPESDTWTPTFDGGAPEARRGGAFAWNGDKALAWGGESYSSAALRSGGLYDPALDSWDATPEEGAPQGRLGDRGVWAGREWIVWGDRRVGARFDPVTGEWTPLPTDGFPDRTGYIDGAWTGSELLLWGTTYLPGGAYSPATDRWRPLPIDGGLLGPTPSFVWSGEEMLGWGDQGTTFHPGAAYRPDLDSWRPIPTEGAPSRRWGASVVWTSAGMAVWGGQPDSIEFADDGGVYDARTDRWEPMSSANAPQARASHGATILGDEMVILGGVRNGFDYSYVPLVTGGRWRPATNRWTATSTENAPPALLNLGRVPLGIGNVMLVLGGTSSGWSYSTRCVDEPPDADAGPDLDYECTGNGEALARLDGSRSTDDRDPLEDLSFAWREADRTLATGAIAEIPLSLGSHAISLEVRDTRGGVGGDALVVDVRDTIAPEGGILHPARGECLGPDRIPVRVEAAFADGCDPAPVISFEPAGPPAFEEHGDHTVRAIAADASGNAAAFAVDFTIDLVAPRVSVTLGTAALVLPSVLQIDSDDDDGATGGVVRERVLVAGCVIWDGDEVGDRDGLLHDETLVLDRGILCAAAPRCGWSGPIPIDLVVEATDCGGNVGRSARVSSGTVRFRPGHCGAPAELGGRRIDAGRFVRELTTN